MKSFAKFFIGAVFGFFIMYAFLGLELEISMFDIAYELIWILGSISLILLVLALVGMLQIKRKASSPLEGEEEDDRDKWQYKKFNDVSLVGNISMIFSIVTLSIVIVTKQELLLTICALILVLISGASSFVSPYLMKVMYPERDLPEVSDKDYTKKLLASSDEGERHVMLEGLYYTFNSTNILLVGAMIILTVYSVSSEQSQLFAIFIIGLILITINTQYILQIRNK
ncbi:DUF3169 family protein [Gracilibacillus thailandensis]|uniref:DUF3169 family protein n=1 Tax=Gracilibacillus thailandensis TaxID=563735 RepID=A0A6N7R4Z7_9BACI|nr:DUF3169 family protein [Gracilibacillus thailandensis]MRI68299.1 DUF3169 family protein [Gracilibacillus thailandensis]